MMPAALRAILATHKVIDLNNGKSCREKQSVLPSTRSMSMRIPSLLREKESLRPHTTRVSMTTRCNSRVTSKEPSGLTLRRKSSELMEMPRTLRMRTRTQLGQLRVTSTGSSRLTLTRLMTSPTCPPMISRRWLSINCPKKSLSDELKYLMMFKID